MITEKAFAKLNICLAVGERLENGYHTVASLMQTISLGDVVHLEKADTIRLCCKGQALSEGEDNLAYRAARSFFDYSGIEGGVSIALEKQIPQGAGLGGGSADAAAVLRGLDRLYQTGYGKKRLAELGAALGADVPFCVVGGTASAAGVGEVLAPAAHRELCYVLLFGGEVLSTPLMYRALDAGENAYTVAAARDFLDKWQTVGGFEGAGNSFLPLAAERDPSVKSHIALLEGLGCSYASISGKGPTVFGVFYDEGRACLAAEKTGGVFAKSVTIE